VEPSPNPCPVLGRASFLQFLADPNLGTQPDRPATEQEEMVQPPLSVTSGGRPESVGPRPCAKSITTGKYDEFRSHYRTRLLLPTGSPDAQRTPVEAGQARRHPEREMSLSGEPSPSLAPDEQPGLGRGGGELAEWLSLFNPGGGVEAPRLPEPVGQAPVQPGVAELSDLIERWVRRVALGGDQRRGAARLDIGHGRFAGAELLVVAEAGRVSVELSLPGMVDADLSQRLQSRLERRGYVADVVVR
jgi:hypothetical protein